MAKSTKRTKKSVPVATVVSLPIRRIISGGQTGADQGAIEGAYSLNVKTGGWAPKGYRTENGRNFDLSMVYKLKEDTSADYRSRTLRNVLKADMTIIVTSKPIKNDSGTALTINLCRAHRKATLIMEPTKKDALRLAGVVKYHAGYMIQNLSGRAAYLKALRRPGLILNFAGPRESKEVGLQVATKRFVRQFLNNIQ